MRAENLNQPLQIDLRAYSADTIFGGIVDLKLLKSNQKKHICFRYFTWVLREDRDIFNLHIRTF